MEIAVTEGQDKRPGKKLEDLRFDILRNAIYHTARRSFLDRCNRIFNFVVILLGASAIGQFGAKFGITDQILIAAATVFATLQLVFDFGVKARDHEFLQRRYYELLAKTENSKKENGSLSDELLESSIANWNSELFLLYAEEPPPLRALDAVAYNSACDNLGKDFGRVKVNFIQNLLRHIYPFNGVSFPYVEDKR